MSDRKRDSDPEFTPDDLVPGGEDLLRNLEDGLEPEKKAVSDDRELQEGDRSHRRNQLKKRISRIATVAAIIAIGVSLLLFGLRGCSGSNEGPGTPALPSTSQNGLPDELSQENLDIPPRLTPSPTSTTPKPPPLSRNEQDLDDLSELTLLFADSYFSAGISKEQWLGAMEPSATPRLMEELRTVDVDNLFSELPLVETITPVELGDNTAIMQVTTDGNTVARLQAVREGDRWIANRFSFRILAR